MIWIGTKSEGGHSLPVIVRAATATKSTTRTGSSTNSGAAPTAARVKRRKATSRNLRSIVCRQPTSLTMASRDYPVQQALPCVIRRLQSPAAGRSEFESHRYCPKVHSSVRLHNFSHHVTWSGLFSQMSGCFSTYSAFVLSLLASRPSGLIAEFPGWPADASFRLQFRFTRNSPARLLSPLEFRNFDCCELVTMHLSVGSPAPTTE